MKRIFAIIGNIYMGICTIAVTIYFIFFFKFTTFGGLEKMQFLDISNSSICEQIQMSCDSIHLNCDKEFKKR